MFITVTTLGQTVPVRSQARGWCGKPTAAGVEIKKPAGKWEKMSGESYSRIEPDLESGMPGGLGLDTISGLTLLMQDNKDRQLFARMTTPKN
jgi:hypothetical protein